MAGLKGWLMAKQLDINITNLLIDTKNPRLDNTPEGQADAIRAIAVSQGKKLRVLAQHIISNGLNPIENILVIPENRSSDRYIVLEGNRRIAALKILDNPEIIHDVVDNATYSSFRKLSKLFRDDPIYSVTCTVFDTRAEANLWIELKHTGENNGAGTVQWGASEVEKFKLEMHGQTSPALQILDMLLNKKCISLATKQQLPITNLQRLIQTPYVRKMLGITIEGGRVVPATDTEEMLKRLKVVVEALARGDIKVSDLYLAEDRISYINSIFNSPPPPITKPSSHGLGVPEPTTPGAKQDTTKKHRSIKPLQKLRKTLIPAKTRLEIGNERINQIYHELRKLNVENFTNSVSITFRVFLELSVDDYSDRNGLGLSERDSLSHKMLKVAEDLKARGKLSDSQLKPVRRAAQKDYFLGTTVSTMHQYVHNRYFFPSTSDVLAAWDNLEPFFIAIWES